MRKHIPTSLMSPYTPTYSYGDKGDIHIGERARARHPVPNVPNSESLGDPAKQPVVSIVGQSDLITFARKLRERFGQGVSLKFHVEHGKPPQGRQPYWWGVFHENGDGV